MRCSSLTSDGMIAFSAFWRWAFSLLKGITWPGTNFSVFSILLSFFFLSLFFGVLHWLLGIPRDIIRSDISSSLKKSRDAYRSKQNNSSSKQNNSSSD